MRFSNIGHFRRDKPLKAGEFRLNFKRNIAVWSAAVERYFEKTFESEENIKEKIQ